VIPCDKEELLRDMHADIKVLVSEFKRMNGALIEFKEHKKESDEIFRPMILNHDIKLKDIREEKLNTQKNAQWRVAIIAGLPGAILALLKIWEVVNK